MNLILSKLFFLKTLTSSIIYGFDVIIVAAHKTNRSPENRNRNQKIINFIECLQKILDKSLTISRSNKLEDITIFKYKSLDEVDQS